ncbi:MAG: hypothetical protein C0518_13000 [Opitutus sp.]|nr:hypothetical protein [Opitutus sp.]
MNALMAEARRMAPSLTRGTPVVYFLRLRSGTPYVGASVDLEQRLGDHASGQACRTTSLDVPFALLRVEICSTFSEARQREAQLKPLVASEKGSVDPRQCSRTPFDGLRLLMACGRRVEYLRADLLHRLRVEWLRAAESEGQTDWLKSEQRISQWRQPRLVASNFASRSLDSPNPLERRAVISDHPQGEEHDC